MSTYGERSDAWYRFQASNARIYTLAVAKLWQDAVDPANVSASWNAVTAEAVRLSIQGGVSAGSEAGRYVGMSVGDSALVKVDPRPLISGVDVLQQMRQISGYTIRQMNQGVPAQRAMANGQRVAGNVAGNTARDAGRHSEGAAQVADTRVRGWVRRLQAPSCGRCTVLADVVYEWNDGFLRHPQCDCVHRPLNSDEYKGVNLLAGGPDQTFKNLSTADQDKYFGKAEAAEIRGGKSVQKSINRKQAGMSYGRRPPTSGTALSEQNHAQLRDVLKQSGGDREKAIGLLRERGVVKPRVNPA
jgi:hypothetical protein